MTDKIGSNIVGAHGFPSAVSIKQVLDLAHVIGKELLKRQPDVVAVANGEKASTDEIWAEKKPDGSSLTSSDIWANGEIVSFLEKLPLDFERIGIVTEEGDKDANRQGAAKESAFVIDPLDNTGDYKRGKNNWSVTIGFAENKKPTGGVVYYPAQGNLYYTDDDGNSYCLNEKLGTTTLLTGRQPKQPSQNIAGKSTLCIVTDFNVAAETANFAQNVINQHAVHTDRYWDVTLSDGADIAEHGDLFYSWDLIGPAAIAARAGVIYIDRSGTPLDFLISNPGHNDFEMPRNGFIAGNKETLKNFGILKQEL